MYSIFKQALNKNIEFANKLNTEEVNSTMENREADSFAGLPAELLISVIQHCDMQDLATLSGVAKKFNNICRPIIFRDVDLSIHNRGKVLCTFPTKYQCPPSKWNEPSDSLQCNNIPPNVQKRQEAFLSALIKDPSLAQHVKNFSWTLLLLENNRRTDLGIDPFEINKSVSLDPKSPFTEIWNVFASLTSVRTLDLAWLSRHLAMPLIHSIPPVLFPAATSVRLVGVMPYSLAASILLANPQALLHLDINNLQQSGIIPSTHIDEVPNSDDVCYETYDKYAAINSIIDLAVFDNYLDEQHALEDLLNEITQKQVSEFETRPANPIRIPNLNAPHLQRRRSWNNLALFEDDSEYFNAPGPMQNLLGVLAGKCTSLKTLRLRKVGARDEFDFTPACRSKETDIYAEWALFLSSVRPTLESLTFEQGERLLPKADWVQPRVRPMDQLFGDTIFPILTTAGLRQWPKMKELVVRGVQQWEEDDGKGTGETVLVGGRGELSGAFGKGVALAMERRAGEADHLGMSYI